MAPRKLNITYTASDVGYWESWLRETYMYENMLDMHICMFYKLEKAMRFITSQYRRIN